MKKQDSEFFSAPMLVSFPLAFAAMTPVTTTSHPALRRKYETEAQRWRALLQKDAAADGHFLYSVRTTGIYCRPSCASRMPLRKNVDFHPTCQVAEAAGFRACKRCHPSGPDAAARHAAMIVKACRLIDSSDEIPALDRLAVVAGMSRFHFHRTFKAITGVTPNVYARAQRANRVRQELAQQRTVTDALYRAGFVSSGRFYAGSSAMLGMRPAKFRQGGAGETLRFAVGECDLGSILVAASATGICAITLGDDPGALVKALQQSFPRARLVGGDVAFERWVVQVVGWVDAPELGRALPLDIRGTAFQRRVWQALREIPPGKTLSYTEVARHIGAPKAIRAVASACAANQLALAIPCHRVVRRNGALSGYRWGVERKRRLLQREAGGAGAP
ncbi:MAG: hypothetical protein RIQ93_1446 [Verrucomicrobiota bacterium]|jgi:AraC family transcriptional regulator of adaptative response/methylated-DNA-[protein]-cysteine methyltransferase